MESKKEREAVDQLAASVSMLIDTAARFLREQEVMRATQQGLVKELEAISLRVAKIIKTLHEGNGERSITTRLAVLEDKVSSQAEEIESARNLHQTNESARISGKWAVIVAVISSIGLLGAAFLGSKLFG